MTISRYTEYVIGINPDGYNIVANCDPTKIEDRSIPIYFKRFVLSKYYDFPQKYNVVANTISSNEWCLSLLGVHKKYVAVSIVELGMNLNYEEQLYWRSFNISPPDVKHWSQILEDGIFKERFLQFNSNWEDKYGWPLFIPLEEKDEHYFLSLRVPLSDEQSEFDYQVLSLTKIFIDSINERKLNEVTLKDEHGKRGIALLEQFLKQEQFSEIDTHINFLKGIYWLRSSGVGHLKGLSYEEAKKYFEIEKQSLTDTVIFIFNKLNSFLNALESKFLGAVEGTADL
jgi:hypothetical protein